MIRDRRGVLWAGTEDKGVWSFDGTKWTQWTTKNGLGDDNAYAMVCDSLGRVWVGHLNSGISVWNGQSWKNYGILDGPLGERVFAVAVAPGEGGDVWMATNAGLSRYSLRENRWSHFTRANGLPTIEISCLAFDSTARLYVGTQCEGLLVGNPDDGYSSWRQIKGAESLPLVAAGEGLPSNFINDILVTEEEDIFVATNAGLARSTDFGQSFSFLRGRDWDEKVAGLWKKKTAILPDPATFKKSFYAKIT